jgi:signal transduction histidine kinase
LFVTVWLARSQIVFSPVEFIMTLTMIALRQDNANVRPQKIGSSVTGNVVPLTVHGVVDPEGRLIAADHPLLMLHRQAGGEEGGALAIPQIAALARLSHSLGMQVSRTVIAADGDVDLDLTVQAKPQDGATQLAINGWYKRSASVTDSTLRAERAQYYAKVENDGTWQCDEFFRFSEFPPSLARVTKMSADQAIGQSVTRVLRFVEDSEGDMPIIAALAMRTDFAGQLAELRADADIQLWFSGEPKIDSTGRFLGYSGGYSFVDQQKAMQVNAQSDHIGTNDNDEASFAQTLDDALRQPIARIIANADQISTRSNGPIRQDYAAYANDISAAGRHLLGLIDDISDMQAIEQQAFMASNETVDLTDIARRAAGLLKVRAADQAVRIDAPPADEAIEAKGDFRRVLQIIVNLVSNAVRYSPDGSSVWIRTEVEGDLAAVVVADQGKGIAPDDQARIFEKFERVNPNEPGGTGLGLYISRRLARAMGGDINVDSAPGQGSRFVLTLPLA